MRGPLNTLLEKCTVIFEVTPQGPKVSGTGIVGVIAVVIVVILILQFGPALTQAVQTSSGHLAAAVAKPNEDLLAPTVASSPDLADAQPSPTGSTEETNSAAVGADDPIGERRSAAARRNILRKGRGQLPGHFRPS